MIKKEIIGIAAVVIAGAFIFTSCKTTEKNYQQAYEIAQKKRVDTTGSYELGADVKLLSMDGSRQVSVNGRKYPVRTVHVSPVDSTQSSQPEYLLIVARFKMPTNARGVVRMLQEEGYKDATLVFDKDQEYMSVASVASTIEEISKKADEFRERHKDYPYIGLEGSFLIIERPGRK